jgi:hypothetical protein
VARQRIGLKAAAHILAAHAQRRPQPGMVGCKSRASQADFPCIAGAAGYTRTRRPSRFDGTWEVHMKQPMRVAGILAAMTAGGSALGDFSGPYAPEQWTFLPGPSGLLLEHSTDALIFQNDDLGFAGTSNITVVAAATGLWTFDWAFTAGDTTAFDHAYFLINDAAVYLGSACCDVTITGTAAMEVQAGDVIGFRIVSQSGIFGPATMTVTNFIAPLPSPPFLALMACAACAHGSGGRRRTSD